MNKKTVKEVLDGVEWHFSDDDEQCSFCPQGAPPTP